MGTGREGAERLRDSPWAAVPGLAGCRCPLRSHFAGSLPGSPWGKAKGEGCARPEQPPVPTGCPYLLDSGQALELGAGEVLLLERGRLQHEVLLLCRVHLLQVLRCCVGLPVQRLLDHLWGGNVALGCATTPPAPPNPAVPPSPIPARSGGRGCRCRRRSGARAGAWLQCWQALGPCHRRCWREPGLGAAHSPWRGQGGMEGVGQTRAVGEEQSEGVPLAPRVQMRNGGLESQRRRRVGWRKNDGTLCGSSSSTNWGSAPQRK